MGQADNHDDTTPVSEPARNDYGFPLVRIASGKNRSALRLAEKAHRGQKRKTGDDVPYILHPIAVAEVLAGVGADRNLVCAGCLHDVVEDCPEVTLDQIRGEFGDTVARLVDAVTKPRGSKAVRLEDQATFVHERVTDAGPDAVALKSADLLVNMTDLVLDAEQHGVEYFAEVFKAHRAARKLRHYLDLAALLADELDATRYSRLGGALRDRATELAALLDEYERTCA